VQTVRVTARSQCMQACGVSGSIEGVLLRRARNQSTMSILRAVSRAVICLVRWITFEVLPVPMSTRGYLVVGAACRLVSCGVAFRILSVELQTSAVSHGGELALLWAASGLTALLIGNIAREWLFGVCLSIATFAGHVFHREGVTLSGRAFLEVHYPAMTWVRCEFEADEFSCEWTEPTGRCNRIDIPLRANSAGNAEKLRPEIRVTTAPRIVSG
jgi:hypothetical protein